MGKYSNFADLMGFESEQGSDGSFQLELPLQPHLYQDDGTIHPGVFSTMLDIIMGATISRTYYSFSTTINLNISYFNLLPQVRYRAETVIIHQDGDYVTAEGSILGENQEIVAKGVGTFKIKKNSRQDLMV